MKLLIAALCAVALSACAPSHAPINQEQLAQANSQADLNALKSRTQEMRMRLEEIEAVLGRQGTGFTLDDVNRRLAQLEETVARMAATLGVDTGARAPSSSTGQVPTPAPSGPGLQPAPGSSGYSGSPAYPAQAPPASPMTMEPESTDPAAAIFNMAMESYNQRDYDRANTLFTELLKSYPSSRQAPDALFWQADANFQQGDYARAALICQDLIQKSPHHPRVASAMIKQGLCFRKLGKVPAARIVFQDVVKRFPGSPEARSAQAQLGELR